MAENRRGRRQRKQGGMCTRRKMDKEQKKKEKTLYDGQGAEVSARCKAQNEK